MYSVSVTLTFLPHKVVFSDTHINITLLLKSIPQTDLMFISDRILAHILRDHIHTIDYRGYLSAGGV